MARQVNEAGLELIQHFEALELKAYQDCVGVWTIGWGHTGLCHGGASVEQGQEITRQQAEQLLIKDLAIFEQAVENMVQVEVNDNQFSALVSFAFNLGETNLRQSTLLKKLNEGDAFAASKEFKRWNKAGGKRMAGLVRRRLSERNLFCSFSCPIMECLPANWQDIYSDL